MSEWPLLGRYNYLSDWPESQSSQVIGKFIVTKLDAKEFDCVANILGVICDNLILVAANPIVGKRERLLEYLVNLRPPVSMISEMLVANALVSGRSGGKDGRRG